MRRPPKKGGGPGTVGPRDRANSSVLPTDGPKQLTHHVLDGGAEVPKGPRATTTRPSRVEGDIGFKGTARTHLHVAVRDWTGHLECYCAVVQNSPIHAHNGAVPNHFRRQARLTKVEPQTPQVDKSMLVLIPEVVERSDFLAIEPMSLWVGLQRLDKCLWAGTDAVDFRHPAAVGPRPTPRAPGVDLVEPPLRVVDGERAMGEATSELLGRDRATEVVYDQPVDALVERRAEIVQCLPEDYRPFNGDRLAEAQTEEVFASLVVYLWHKSPWLVLRPRRTGEVVPGGHFTVEESQVVFCSAEFDLYGSQGRRIDFHDLLWEKDAESGGA
jgi:hypothetical protein